MIPLQLHLTDFLSYRSMPEPLDFTQISIACLSGANGHGKSALLDAITWSLWGKARGCEGGQEQERLIRDGAESMRVEFVFELDGQTYRVARSRTKSGKADIAFNIRGPDGSWTDLAGEGIADTQRRIIERLRMDYETFVASAFILQGRADTFTRLDPRQRKDVLGKILGLEIYERLAERAKDRRKETLAESEAASTLLASLETDIGERPGLEHRKADAEVALAAALTDRATATETLTRIRSEVGELRSVQAAATEAAKRLEESRAMLEGEDKEIARLNEEAAELEARAVVDPAAEAEASRVELLEREERSMEESRRRHDELTGEAASVHSRIEQEKARLEAGAAGHERNAAALERELAAEVEARALLERAEAEIAALDEASAEREQLLARHAEIRERIGALDAQRQAREGEQAELDEKRSLLESTGAACPLCGQSLTAAHRKQVRAGLDATAKELRAADVAAAKEEVGLQAELKKVEKRGAALRTALERRETLARQAAQLGQQLEQLGAARTRIDAELTAVAEIVRRLDADDYAAGEREKLARLREEISAAGFDAKEHAALKAALKRARDAEKSIAAARQAGITLAAIRKETAAAEKRFARARKSHDQVAEDLSAMGERLVGLAGLEEELAAGERAATAAQERFEVAGSTLAATAQALEALERKAAEAAKVKEVLAAAKRTAGLYEKLGKAFGRDGIPARIIGNAIPELRIEANRLLALLTDGQLSMSIDPVRETKSRNMKETLEVTVFDAAGGKRAYEMYSGGERLRIDFALRVALSRLLANRAGARLETLVIDEGFGSQDAEGRSRLLEAVLRVRSEFRMVLVITHIDELKEHFPVRIEVRKDPDAGSLVSVV